MSRTILQLTSSPFTEKQHKHLVKSCKGGLNFSTDNDPKAMAKTAAAAKTTTATRENQQKATPETRVHRESGSKHNEQREKQHKARKANIKQQQKWQKKTQKITEGANNLEGRRRQGSAFHTTSATRRPECRVCQTQNN